MIVDPSPSWFVDLPVGDIMTQRPVDGLDLGLRMNMAGRRALNAYYYEFISIYYYDKIYERDNWFQTEPENSPA